VERQPDYEKLCEQYLLGELSEAEQAKLEEAYFADDSLFERFLAVKDDLLDAYSRGDLTDQKLEHFEQHYLTSEARRQRVEETRELIQATSAAANNESFEPLKSDLWSWWQLFAKNHPIVWRVGLVTAALLLVAGSWIIIRQIRESAARRAAEERARNGPQPPVQNTPNVTRPQETAPTPGLEGERATASPSPSAPVKPEIAPKPQSPTSTAIASLTLLPFAAREAGSANTLAISPEQRVVRLNLVFGDGFYDSFEVSVRTVDGGQVIRRNGLRAKGRTVTLTFDSALLRRQDHLVTLSGRTKEGKPQTIAEYYFRVQRPTPQ
jgi:hypothetical protein